jgi:hypothetical protein
VAGCEGKGVELVSMATMISPVSATLIPSPRSDPVPPAKVEATSAVPEAFSTVTNASAPPAYFGWKALAVVGKSEELVVPIM